MKVFAEGTSGSPIFDARIVVGHTYIRMWDGDAVRRSTWRTLYRRWWDRGTVRRLQAVFAAIAWDAEQALRYAGRITWEHRPVPTDVGTGSLTHTRVARDIGERILHWSWVGYF